MLIQVSIAILLTFIKCKKIEKSLYLYKKPHMQIFILLTFTKCISFVNKRFVKESYTYKYRFV